MSTNNDKILIKFEEIKTPPMSSDARKQTGLLLRRLQQGESLSMPHSKPIGTIGHNCHELRIRDDKVSWRVMYYIDSDAIVVLMIFPKKTGATPQKTIDTCKTRLNIYLDACS